jgi:hypothetical protein
MAPLYLAEIAPPQSKGMIGTLRAPPTHAH